MLVLKGGFISTKGNDLTKKDILIDQGKIIKIADDLTAEEVLDITGLVVLPGFIDTHVHLRDPGLTHKETVKTGSMAALHGGYTSIFAMPNVKPVPSTKEVVKDYLKYLKENALINVYPYASITLNEKGEELVDFQSIKELGVYYFSDDGVGVQDNKLMKEALEKAKELDLILACHTEQASLLKEGACLFDGPTCKALGEVGISNEVESQMIKRDLALNRTINAKYHVCHISAAESVDLIRYYKGHGLDVSAEVCMHHLLLNESDVKDTNYKMNPPLKLESDRLACIKGIQDGTIEILASDHAPHTLEEKARGFRSAPFGIVGLETSLPLAYTYLVKTGIITLEDLIKLGSTNPAKRFRLSHKGELKEGFDADLAIVKLDENYKIDANQFYSMGKNTPFDGWDVSLKVAYTLVNGEIKFKGGNR